MDFNLDKLDYGKLLEPLEVLRSCSICPRNCNADRFSGKHGYCNAGASFSISSICIHRGEEPAISGSKGICNIFFTNCNLQCVYCQNYQISCNKLDYSDCRMELKNVLKSILYILNTGINIVGFVSPSHFIPQVKVIIDALRALGLDPDFVFNTNAYDKVQAIHDMQPYFNVYLPDYKYTDPVISKAYSDVADYPEIALQSLKEMFRQTGPKLYMNSEGYATKGMIIRHLVLPGHADNSIQVLRNIAEHLSPEIHISLMSQYYPTAQVRGHETLGRTLKAEEYFKVVNEMERLGFSNGWVQDIVSNQNYRPDFMNEHPFQK